jgi:hypothetical protein
MKARRAIDKAIVNIMTDNMGRPDSGWINTMWINTPVKAAADTIKTRAKGNGKCNSDVATTAK